MKEKYIVYLCREIFVSEKVTHELAAELWDALTEFLNAKASSSKPETDAPEHKAAPVEVKPQTPMPAPVPASLFDEHSSGRNIGLVKTLRNFIKEHAPEINDENVKKGSFNVPLDELNKNSPVIVTLDQLKSAVTSVNHKSLKCPPYRNIKFCYREVTDNELMVFWYREEEQV